MNKITELTIGNIIHTFLENRPVNRLIRIAFLKGEKTTDCIELFKNNVHFRYLENSDTVCHLRVHQSRLLSHIQVDLNKEEYGTERFVFMFNGETIPFEVTHDNSLWYTITSPKLDEIATLAIQRAKE